jgi:hypothetical protein
LKCEGLGLSERLLNIGMRELVKASPTDRILGIGFNKSSAESIREEWGLNSFGKALTRVRDRLRAEEARDAQEIVKEGDMEAVKTEEGAEIEKDR